MLSRDENQVDKVTIGLYSIELPDGSFSRVIFQQKNNIRRMQEGFAAAAKAYSKQPPEVVLSVLLIPNWGRLKNSYEDKQYLDLKRRFFQALFAEFKDVNVVIQDFSSHEGLMAEEKSMMHRQQSAANNLDMLKVRAVIDNKKHRHLQLDSNTKIYDFKRLYRQTFGASASQQADALMACCYSKFGYVSAQNKIVYTTPTGKLAKALEEKSLQYFKAREGSQKDKGPGACTIYQKIFGPALCDIDFVRKITTQGLIMFPASMNLPNYRITYSLIGAINMSWNVNSKIPAGVAELNRLPAIIIGDAYCDFQSFLYVIKKLTKRFTLHSKGLPKMIDAKKQLLGISNVRLELRMLVEFYNHVLNNHSDCIAKLAEVIPCSPQGDRITLDLFGCKTQLLHGNAKQQAYLPLHARFSQRLLPYPHYLIKYGLSEKKATGPRIAAVLEKISKIEGSQTAVRIARSVMFWAKSKKRNLNLEPVKALCLLTRK